MRANTQDQQAIGEQTRGDRRLGYVLARSFALLAMFLVHFGLVMAAD